MYKLYDVLGIMLYLKIYKKIIENTVFSYDTSQKLNINVHISRANVLYLYYAQIILICHTNLLYYLLH